MQSQQQVAEPVNVATIHLVVFIVVTCLAAFVLGANLWTRNLGSVKGLAAFDFVATPIAQATASRGELRFMHWPEYSPIQLETRHVTCSYAPIVIVRVSSSTTLSNDTTLKYPTSWPNARNEHGQVLSPKTVTGWSGYVVVDDGQRDVNVLETNEAEHEHRRLEHCALEERCGRNDVGRVHLLGDGVDFLVLSWVPRRRRGALPRNLGFRGALATSRRLIVDLEISDSFHWVSPGARVGSYDLTFFNGALDWRRLGRRNERWPPRAHALRQCESSRHRGNQGLLKLRIS